ncbi:uncharacterized protein LOC111397730 [Olea europaea var. sylvestris]|uniref:Uncharacterized protein n=1 Tax=Olea europaea subsp. europaea TaxID=158383 RepID=A0A8S0PLM8_OLEEU|nr:uncharacterized protein LOC111397730 [Olea europaea var. sylvestris]CAA2955099.1 Hypothetical predicted protein [Olea europaea subsp. europaea]
MESNRKRRGFIKAKMIMSLYQTKKKTPPPEQVYSQQMHQIKQKAPPLAAPVGFVVNQEQIFPQQIHQTKQDAGFIMNQEQVFPQQTQKVSIVVHEKGRDSHGKLDNFYCMAGDECIDAKAASYISSVQERFRVEHVNSEREMFEDIYTSKNI